MHCDTVKNTNLNIHQEELIHCNPYEKKGTQPLK